ncbi:MAG: NADH-quinone oxidoreductase subunit N, partial [Anaerolineae bacterium]
MTATDLLALLPWIVLAATSVVTLLAIAWRRSHGLAAGLALAGLALAFAALPLAAGVAPRPVTSLVVVDGYALFFVGLLLAAAFVVGLLAHGYLAMPKEDGPDTGGPAYGEEFYVLLLLATLGGAILVASRHLASFFLGLELLSVPLYGLMAFLRRRERGLEAGFKYLILAATSSAILLFGMALVYARQGTLAFGPDGGLSEALSTQGTDLVLLSGLALIVAGFGFKLGVVPFHLWTPDVYEGAPAPVTAFVATVSKGAVFALLLRFFAGAGPQPFRPLWIGLAAVAVASMFGGNLLGLLQDNLKRLLAYSSIAHLGYLLVAFLSGGELAATAVSFYLVAYLVTTLGAFGVVTVLSPAGRDADRVDDYRGLFWRRPWPAALLAACLFSLAGMPLTAGFVGKFYLVAAGVGADRWLLALALV